MACSWSPSSPPPRARLATIVSTGLPGMRRGSRKLRPTAATSAAPYQADLRSRDRPKLIAVAGHVDVGVRLYSHATPAPPNIGGALRLGPVRDAGQAAPLISKD